MPKATPGQTFADMNPISPPHRLTCAEYAMAQAFLKEAYATLDHPEPENAEALKDAKYWGGSAAVEPSFTLNDVIMKLAWGLRGLGAQEAHHSEDANPEAFRLVASVLSDVILIRAAAMFRTEPVDDEGPL